MSALKDQILNDLSVLENTGDLKNIAQYLHVLKAKAEWSATLDILNDKTYLAGLLKGIQNVKNGKYRSFDEIKKERKSKK